jgi:RNA polymerase sigma-70 factor (ECF subfamily)
LKETEKTLVARLKNDDRIAFEKLFQLYSERIYYFSIRYIKNKQEAEEITQEVFIRLWNRRLDLKLDLSFSSYLYMIAKNAVIDLLRKRQKELNYNDELSPGIDAKAYATNDSIEFKELNSLVSSSIAELPSKRRQIFLMSRDEGLTYKQIGEKLDISIKTVESHMRLALQQLRKSIGDNYELILFIIFFIPFM